MVGRTLTVARVRELNAYPDFVDRMLDMNQIAIEASKSGMRVFFRALLGFGIKPDEVKMMLKDNPAKLMWLGE